jgi:hypothetical protein
MKKVGRKISPFFLILSLLFLFTHCGAGAPPASIPAPVASFLTASAPAGNPLTTTITGAPGAVQANSTVTLANVSQGGTTQLRKDYFIKSAYAQTAPFVQTTADNQGAFTAPPLSANPGNNDIAIRYRNPQGDVSEEVIFIIPCGPPGSPTECQVFQINP